MKVAQINVLIRILVFLIISSFLFPTIRLLGFGMKLDLLFLYPLFFLVLLLDNFLITKRPIKINLVFGLLIFFSMLISNALGYYNFDSQINLSFPTEYLQILNRIIIFYCFVFIAYKQILTLNRFLYISGIVFFMALVVGSFQSIGFNPVVEFSKVYALSDNQVKGFESLNSRVFGTSGNILTWAGLSGFFFLFFLYVYNHNKYIKYIGVIMSMLNIAFAASRGAILALILTIIIANVLKGIFEKNIRKPIGRILQISLILFFIGYSFYIYFPDRIDMLLFRFQNLENEVSDTGRAIQLNNIQTFVDLDKWNYLFGIGKNQLDKIDLMEVEFFFNLFSYGIFGCLAIYIWVFLLMKEGFKLKNYNQNITLFIISAFIFYLIFSFGYFFIKEIYSGLIFWYIIGYLFGYLIRLEDKYV